MKNLHWQMQRYLCDNKNKIIIRIRNIARALDNFYEIGDEYSLLTSISVLIIYFCVINFNYNII